MSRLDVVIRQQKIILAALEKYRSLTVDEMLDLAERYVVENCLGKPWFEKVGRSMPINQRAFYACENLVQWGDCKCR